MTAVDTFVDEPLLGDDTRATFPQPLAHALDTLVEETRVSGESTTADELAAAIEETFIWLGSLWVAEYLRAVEFGVVAVDDNLHRDLLERVIGSDRPLLTGQWVGIARRARAHLADKKTVVEGLAAVDFGDFGDNAHPVARLIAFRNEFAHGSFQASVSRIREHRRLLHDLLARLPALRAQPPLFLDVDGRVVRAATGVGAVVDAPAGDSLPAAHPMIIDVDGARLDLYPLVHATMHAGRPTLSAPNALHPVTSLRERQALVVWSGRYERERAGLLEWPAIAASTGAPPALIEALRSTLSARDGGLVLVEAHPGARSGAAIAALVDDDPLGLGLSRFSAVSRVAVRPAEPSQSGFTIAQVVLRLVERALGEKSLSRSLALKDLLGSSCPLRAALRDLQRAGRSVCLGLDELHHGLDSYRGEPVTVRQVYEALGDSRVVVIATTVPGGLERPLYDARIVVEAPTDLAVDEVKTWTRRLLTTPLHRRVLRELVAQDAPLHLFSLCDALDERAPETDPTPVFEPAVERALWDLRPLLSWRREAIDVEGSLERVRLWSVFSPAARVAMKEVLS